MDHLSCLHLFVSPGIVQCYFLDVPGVLLPSENKSFSACYLWLTQAFLLQRLIYTPGFSNYVVKQGSYKRNKT